MPEKSRRGYLLALVTVVYAFNFLDRNALGLLMQNIKGDLHLSDTQMGFLTGIAFAFFYSLFGVPIAHWADRGNRITIIWLTTAIWSAMVVCCGLVTSYLQLLAARVGVAVGEAGCVPPAQSLISDYYERAERSRAMSYYAVGGPLSIIVGYGLTGWINQWYGWRAAFFTIGAPGIVLALLVRFSLRDPRATGEVPRPAIRETVGAGEQFSAFLTLWRQKAYRHLVLAYTVIYLFAYGIAQWGPAFLIRTHHVDTGELGLWYAVILGIGGTVGTYLGGAWAGRFAASDEALQLKVMAGALSMVVPIYVGIYLTPTVYVAYGLMTIGAFFYCSLSGPLFAVIHDVVPAHARALSIAIVLFFANLIGMGVGPILVGVASDLLRPVFGEESLRVALLIWTPGFLWAVFHLLRASRYVEHDIVSVERELPGDLGVKQA